MAPSPMCIGLIVAALACSNAAAFQLPISSSPINHRHSSLSASSTSDDAPAHHATRRSILTQTASLVASSLIVSAPSNAEDNMYSPKFVQTYEDFTDMPEGWSYKDVKVGSGDSGGDLKDGDRVVFDWSGYTIGYFGRPFEAKG